MKSEERATPEQRDTTAPRARRATGRGSARRAKPELAPAFEAGTVSALVALDSRGARFTLEIAGVSGIVSAELIGDYKLAVGRAIDRARLPGRRTSILAAASRLALPATVHVAVGTDIIHMHPTADGAAIGEGSMRDFRLLSSLVARLDGGVYINLGSAVLMPEVFVKALNLARNVGHRVRWSHGIEEQ